MKVLEASEKVVIMLKNFYNQEIEVKRVVQDGQEFKIVFLTKAKSLIPPFGAEIEKVERLRGGLRITLVIYDPEETFSYPKTTEFLTNGFMNFSQKV